MINKPVTLARRKWRGDSRQRHRESRHDRGRRSDAARTCASLVPDCDYPMTMPPFSSPAIAPRSTIASSPIRFTAFTSRKFPARRFSTIAFRAKQRCAASTEPVEKGIGQSAENCDTTLVSNRRGNGIHQWNCEGNLIRGNEISDTRDGIYFSFTNNSRVENNLDSSRPLRPALHVFGRKRFREQHVH